MVQVNEYAGAIEHLTRAIELGDRDGRTYGLLGYCYINEENPLSAEEAYRTAVLQQPDSKDWQLGLARSLLALEKYEEAAALFATILEKHPEDASIWKLQANAFIGLDQPLAAAVNLEALRMLGKADISSLVLLGDIYMNEGIRDLAKDAYLAAIDKDSDGTQFRAAYRAADLLFRAAAYDQSAEILASIDRRYAEKIGSEENLELMTLRARIARAQGRDAEAVAILDEIVQRDGTRGDALLELARYHRDQGNEQKALLLLERAQNLPKYQYDALIEQAQFLVTSGDYERAANLLRQALRLKSEPRVERFLARVESAVRK
jgi:tetratricopeptide (TPR) repeat protein